MRFRRATERFSGTSPQHCRCLISFRLQSIRWPGRKMQKTWLCAYARITLKTSEEGTGEAASKSIIAMLFQRKNVSMNRRIAKFKTKAIPPRIALHSVYGAECSTHNPRVWISLSHNRLQLLLRRWFETRRPPHDWDRDVTVLDSHKLSERR